MQKRASPPEFTASMSGGTAHAESEYINFDDIKRFVKRYARIISTFTLVALFAAALYVVFAVPLYTARTQIVIDPSLPQLFSESAGDRIISLDSGQVHSQLAVLRSEKIASSVVDTLDLERNPAFMNNGISLLGLASQFFHAPATAPSDFVKKRLTLAHFERGLIVRRVGISYAIDLSFTASNPQLAAEVANATADAYIQEVIAARAQAARQGSRWLEERIDDLRKQMNAAALKVKEYRSKRDYRIAKKRHGSRDGEGAKTDGRDGALSQRSIEELESRAQTYRRIYESYLVAYNEAVQKQSYPVSNARVITPATAPLRKSYPRTKLILAFGALLGCLAGFGIAIVRHSLDRSVRDARQIREEVGVEHLGKIPLMHLRNPRRSLLERILRFGKQKNQLIAVVDLPFSGFSHGVKRLKAAISLAARTRPIQCVGIASALPNEGKTTISANLAVLFAKTGKRTLIIDCDLHTSELSHQLGVQSEHGLIEAIDSSVDVQNCIVHANDYGVDLLPAIGGETAAYSGELLGSDKMRLLLQRLAETYEIIIVDMSPLAVTVDGLAISSMLDTVVLVAEWGATPIPVLSEVARSLRNARVEILGAVINKVDASTLNYGKPLSQYTGYVA